MESATGLQECVTLFRIFYKTETAYRRFVLSSTLSAKITSPVSSPFHYLHEKLAIIKKYWAKESEIEKDVNGMLKQLENK